MATKTTSNHRIDAERVPVEARGVQRPKKQATMAPKVCQKDAKEDHWPHTVAKRVPKNEPELSKKHTLGVLVFKVEFSQVFYRIWKPKVPEILPQFLEKPHMFRGRLENDKLRFDCAGASGSRVGPSRKAHKNYEETTCEPTHLQDRFYCEK